MENNQNNGVTPEIELLKSEEVVNSSENLSLSDVMQEAMPSEDATTVLSAGSESATTVLTEGMSGPLSGGAPDQGFRNVGSGPLASGQKPAGMPQPGMAQPGMQPMAQPGMQPQPGMPQQSAPQQAMPQQPQNGMQLPPQGMSGQLPPQNGMQLPPHGMSGQMPQQPQNGMQLPPQGMSGQMPPQGMSGAMPQQPLRGNGQVPFQGGMNSVPPQGIRPPRQGNGKGAKLFGLITLILALIGLVAVALLMFFFVISPGGDYKGAADKGYSVSAGTQPGTANTEAATTASTEE